MRAGALAIALLLGAASPAAGATLVHWEHQYAARGPIMGDLVARQARTGTDIRFQPIPYDSYFDKLFTSLRSGTGPDVFKVQSTMAVPIIRAGLAAPAPADVFPATRARRDFVPWTVAPAIHEERVYGLPTDVQTVVLFVNDALLAACGGGTVPRTWSEFREQARKCTRRDADGNLVQAGVDTRYKWAVYTTVLYQATRGRMVDLAAKKALYDGPRGMAAWEFLRDLFSGPRAADSPRFMTGQFKFELGKAAFYLNHPVTRSRLAKMAPDLKYTVALPPSPDGRPATLGSSWLYMVNAKSPHREAAWKWVQALTDRSAQRRFVTEAADLPSLRSLAADRKLFPGVSGKVIQDSLLHAMAPGEVGGFVVEDVRQDAWDRLVLDRGDLNTVVRNAARRESALIRSFLP